MAEEKVTPLLPEHQSKTHSSHFKWFATPESSREGSRVPCSRYIRSVCGAIKQLWIKVVQLLHAREFFAELVATFVLISFGDGAVAQAVLSSGSAGDALSIHIGYGFGVMLGCYVAIGVTGAHMNPAVTLAMALRCKTSWRKVIPYWLAQFLGAFLASAMLYGVYYDALHHYNYQQDVEYCNGTDTFKTPLCTGRIWATYPTPGVHLSLPNGFFDQVVGTLLLLLGIFAACDSSNSEPQAGLKPLIIGFLVTTIGISFGYNSGYAINPARDFGPRVFTAVAGWGKDVFVCSECSIRHWWWVPIVAPMVGAVLGTMIYCFLIEAHHPPQQKSEAAVINANLSSTVNREKVESLC